MTTLKERFEEKFPKQKLFVRENSNEFSNLKSTEELLTFIKQELMLLAKEVEDKEITLLFPKELPVSHSKQEGFNLALNKVATIIRTRADETI